MDYNTKYNIVSVKMWLSCTFQLLHTVGCICLSAHLLRAENSSV